MKRALILRAVKLLNRALAPATGPTPEPSVNRVKDFVQRMHRVRGDRLPFATFYAKFVESVPAEEIPYWSRVRVSRQLRRIVKLRNGAANKLFLLGFRLPE